ncbi:MAG: hypothetical protein EZS28_009200 [Streblomastix strix]|uniref:Uncharacterized protein n=1 Tax=Streblomastix strix TaxID=222440 RepID=A0A5J4WL39_9EUKA|nr:MAG: hypothetical protein EZS28_009200 [Streblomastix strix]
MPNFHEDDDIESRKKDYKGTDVFIICFSLVERKSYENALNFYKELLPFSNNKPIILVGNKLDICDGLETDFAISQVRNQAKTMEFNCEVAAYEEKSRKDVASIQQLLVKAVNLHFHPTLWRDKKEFKKKEQEKTKKGEKSDEKKKCNIQ